MGSSMIGLTLDGIDCFTVSPMMGSALDDLGSRTWLYSLSLYNSMLDSALDSIGSLPLDSTIGSDGSSARSLDGSDLLVIVNDNNYLFNG